MSGTGADFVGETPFLCILAVVGARCWGCFGNLHVLQGSALEEPTKARYGCLWDSLLTAGLTGQHISELTESASVWHILK